MPTVKKVKNKNLWKIKSVFLFAVLCPRVTPQFSKSFGSGARSNNRAGSVWHATITQVNSVQSGDKTQLVEKAGKVGAQHGYMFDPQLFEKMHPLPDLKNNNPVFIRSSDSYLT